MANEVSKPHNQVGRGAIKGHWSNREGRDAVWSNVIAKATLSRWAGHYQLSKEQSCHGWVNPLVNFAFLLMTILCPTSKLILIYNRKSSASNSQKKVYFFLFILRQVKNIDHDSRTRTHSSHWIPLTASHICCPVVLSPPGSQLIQRRNIITFIPAPLLPKINVSALNYRRPVREAFSLIARLALINDLGFKMGQSSDSAH